MIRALAWLCLILLIPLALSDVPPLLDYPNHLARAVVLAFGSSDPVLSRMYAAHWTIIPNLGTDLVLTPLVTILPVHLAGRLVIAISMLLPVLGTVAYSRATFRTNSAWPLASGLVAYNATFLLGFLNFVAAIGIALLLAAAWIAWRDRYPTRVAIAAGIGTVALFFCHLMGLLFFFILIAGFELERAWSLRARPSAIAARVFAAVPMVVAPVALYLMSPLAPLAEKIEWTSAIDKARQLVLPFSNYVLPLDIFTACVVTGFLAACFATGRCRITLGSGLTLLFTWVGFVAAPWAFKGTYFLDTRFAILVAFLLFGAILPSGLPRQAAQWTAAGFTTLFATRMAVVGFAWHGHQQDLADLRAVIAQVEPGARVLTAEVAPEVAPEYWQGVPLARMLSFGLRLDTHLPALLLIERRAFWPFLFDNPSQQPVETLAPYRELAAQADSLVSHQTLAMPDAIDLRGYDYVLLLDAGGQPDLAHFASDRLALLDGNDCAALFRIRDAASLRATGPGSQQLPQQARDSTDRFGSPPRP